MKNLVEKEEFRSLLEKLRVNDGNNSVFIILLYKICNVVSTRSNDQFILEITILSKFN